MKVLILGATGMLGHKLYQVLGESFDVSGTVRGDPSELDVYGFRERGTIIGGVDAEDFETVRRAIDGIAPDVVVNAIGAVKQLLTSTDPVRALTVNSIFPHQLARLTEVRGIRLITISTDCVFSGKAGNYCEADTPDASDLYGISKRFGEPIGPHVLTLRTSIIGRELRTKHGLIEWFLSQRGGVVKGYANAFFSGLTTIAFARLLGNVIADHRDLNGLYHVSSQRISKYDLLAAIEHSFAPGTRIEPSNEVVIDRSLDSSAFRAATGWQPPAWDEMIREMASDHGLYG